MVTKLEIVNRALRRIGAKSTDNLADGSNNSESVNDVYEVLRRSELTLNYWTFAIRRVQLTADVTAPINGRAYQYTLPADYLRRAPDDPGYAETKKDYLLEGAKLLTDTGNTLYLRYVYDVTDDTLFPPLFADALAARLAMELAEPLTGSASKVQSCEAAYTYFIRQAKSVNAIEAGPIEPEIDEMVAVRFSEAFGDPTLRSIS